MVSPTKSKENFKMRYVSDKTGKSYDTEKECLKAEKEFDLEQERKEKEVELQKGLISKEKKELADRITEAEIELEKANKEYELAQDKATEILERSNKEVKEILDPAREKVKAAERAKRDAIIEFNKKFGVYTTKYTGEKAIEEFNKALNSYRFYDPFFDILKKFWF